MLKKANCRSLPVGLRSKISKFIGIHLFASNPPTGKRGRCHQCIRKDRKTKYYCLTCYKFLCLKHVNAFCPECAELFFFIFISIFILLTHKKATEVRIHKVSNYPNLLPEMPRYYCPLEILIEI